LNVLHKNEIKIIEDLQNITDNNISGLLKRHKSIITNLEAVMKAYIEKYALLLDYKNDATPNINNMDDNKVLKFVVDIIAFNVDRYIGENLMTSIKRIIAKDLASKGNDEEQIKGIISRIGNIKVNTILLKDYLIGNRKSNSLMSINMIKNILEIKEHRNENVDELTENYNFNVLKNMLKSSGVIDIDFESSFMTLQNYYASLYREYIVNAFVCIVNYNKYIINQYKFVRTLKELVDKF